MNLAKEMQMWFLHCQLLTKIMVQILNDSEIKTIVSKRRTANPKKALKNNVKVTGNQENYGYSFLKDIFKNKIAVTLDKTNNNSINGAIVYSQNDSEYDFFRKTEKGNREDEISPIMDGLSSPAFQLANIFTRKGFDRFGEMEERLDETALWYILVIGYFNRKICLGAEGVVNKNGNWYKKNKRKNVNDILNYKGNVKKIKKNSNAMRLFLNCLGPRLNYIGADTYKENPLKKSGGQYKLKNDKFTVEKLFELYEGLSKCKKLDVPFSKQIHRLRGTPGSNPLNAHLLGIDAGAHINAITQESTLGKIRQSLGLPLRCDISGTTVDAMGFCNTFIKKKPNNDSNNVERMTYLVSCMLSMCLTGHHSLDEMALALSLEVNEELAKYKPCSPASVIDLLKEWSGWTKFNFKSVDTGYIDRKAKGILGSGSPIKLEFTKKLWDSLATQNKIMKGWTYSNGGNELTYPNKANRNSND